MQLIVGLGNPGKKYEKTLHNVGFILLDQFANANKLEWTKDSKAKAQIIKTEGYILVKPQTFMNQSGTSVSYLMSYFKISPENLLVIHDDIDLAFGQTKLQKNIGSAGHLGIEDIVVSIKTKDFWRFRVGVGRPQNEKISTEDWVLSNFSLQDLEKIQNISLPISG
jgi:PTH1 family peptidyl-tRNA hydrolase